MRSLSLRLILTTAALLLVSHPESRAQNLVFDSSDFASWDHPVGLVNVLSDRVEVKRFGKTFNAVTNADRLSSSIIGDWGLRPVRSPSNQFLARRVVDQEIGTWWQPDPDDALQQWWVEKASDGYFYIHNAHSHLLMTADGYNGNVSQQEKSGDPLQQWSFVLADEAGNQLADFDLENNLDDSTGQTSVYETGSVTFGPGKVGQAAEFDGADSYLELAGTAIDGNAFTFASWVRWDGGDAWQRIFDFGTDT